MDLHVFGIRHHGPGSARSLRAALEDLQPDALLIEGPPDAVELLPLAAHAEMKPPVALLIYVPEEPRRAVYYPFALFSPEWQAIQYGLANNAAVRFMDLPQAHQMALEDPQRRPDEAEAAAAGEQPRMPDVRADPLGWLAEAAGYSDAERWWEHAVEERLDSTDLFAAVCEAITALRETAPPGRRAEPLREAFMR